MRPALALGHSVHTRHVPLMLGRLHLPSATPHLDVTGDTSSLVARQSGARLVVVPQSPGAVKGTEDYVAHIDYLVNAIAAALREGAGQ